MAPHILVVDDEPMVRALVSRALTDDGYQVNATHDGQAALEIARTADPKFDLIVTNTWMPGLSGSELIARLRQDLPGVSTLYKPFSIDALRRAVRELLGG